MNAQARAILWAQFRSLWNYFPRASKGGLIFAILISVFWYGMWAAFAVLGMRLLAQPNDARMMGSVLSGVLLLIFLYWQVIPVLMATTGASLEIKKLRVYPIPHSQLFLIEVMLRVTTGVEMALLLVGIGAGLAMNPRPPRCADRHHAVPDFQLVRGSGNTGDSGAHLCPQARARDRRPPVGPLRRTTPDCCWFRRTRQNTGFRAELQHALGSMVCDGDGGSRVRRRAKLDHDHRLDHLAYLFAAGSSARPRI